MSSPSMPLLDLMPRQICEDVVLIGTYSVIRYAKEMLEFWNRISCRKLIDILYLPAFCFVH